MPPDAAAFTVTSRARFSFSVLLLRWDMELGCYRLGRPGGNGLVTLQSLARSRSARFRNSFSAGIGEEDQNELMKVETEIDRATGCRGLFLFHSRRAELPLPKGFR
jgi:hypothetical protein